MKDKKHKISFNPNPKTDSSWKDLWWLWADNDTKVDNDTEFENKLPKGFRVRDNRLLFNGVDIGSCYQKANGDSVFDPNGRGYMEATLLRGIADTLDTLNKHKK